MHDVFISYSHDDIKVVQRLCDSLESKGIRCWYAKRNIKSGEVWSNAIVKAISESKAFVIVFSDNSNNSSHVLSEISIAMDSNCTIIPFRIDKTDMNDSMSYYLKTVHWLDAAEQPMEAALNKLSDIVINAIGYTHIEEKIIDTNETETTTLPKKKKHTGLVVLAIILASVLLLVTMATAIGLGVARFSDDGKKFTWNYYPKYAFRGSSGLSNDGRLVLLRNEDGTFKLFDTIEKKAVWDGIEYNCEDPLSVYVFYNFSSDYIFFLDYSTNVLQAYNIQKGEFLWNQKGIELELGENETLSWCFSHEPNALLGTEKGTAIALITESDDVENPGLLRSIYISYDENEKTLSVKYISLVHYNLTDVIAGYGKVNTNPETGRSIYAFVRNSDGAFKVLDLTEGELLNIDHDTLVNDYLPYAQPVKDHQSTLSPNGTYYLHKKMINETLTCEIWDIKNTGKSVYDKSISGYGDVQFVSETEIACLDQINKSFYLYDLESGKKTVLLDEEKYENLSNIFAKYPWTFDYDENLGFVLSNYNNAENVINMVVMDINGEVIAYCDSFTPPYASFYVDSASNEDILFYLIEDAETHETRLYLLHYSIDEDGKLQFENE